MLRKKITLYFLTFILFFIFSDSSIAQVKFTKHTISSNLNGAYWVYGRKINNDGNIDLVTSSSQGVDWWAGNGKGGFSKNFVGNMAISWSSSAGDIDGDGDIDIVGGSNITKEIAWFENRGNENFVKFTVENNWNDPETLYTADFDGDGDEDIVSCAVITGEVAWWERVSNNKFNKHIIDSNLPRAHSVFPADFNHNGKIDIVASGSRNMRMYRNDGKGNFSGGGLGSKGAWCVVAADVDSDGDLDVLRTRRDNGDVEWFENNGGSFSGHTIATGYGESWGIGGGDVDNDGDVDVVAAGFAADNVMIWLNDGKENFGKGIVVDNVQTPRFVFIADVDNRGGDDIVAAIRGESELAWYEAEGSGGPNEKITLTQPNGGEDLLINSSYEIRWDWTGNIDKVKIEFSSDDGKNWTTIVDNEPNDGNYDWTVPNSPSDLCLVRISDASNNSISDVSDDQFSIISNQETISLTNPNGGEALQSGSVFKIQWNSSNNFNNVKIELSTDSGTTWTTIENSTNNDGSYNWTVPDTPSDQCLIRLSDASDGDPSDISDSDFSIIKVSENITVTAPNGGEELLVGSGFQIQWNASGSINNVKIELSTDGGGNWSTIVNSTGNDGSYNQWTVPDNPSEQGLIRISDAADGDPSDVSDDVFIISESALLPPELSSFNPLSGSSGTAVTILGSNFIDVSKVAFNGTAASYIVNSETEIQATVPTAATTGKISITTSGGAAFSAQDFTVVPGGEVTILKFYPTEDARVKLDELGTNFGDSNSLKVEKDEFNSYLKFDVTGIVGNVQNAKIRLYVTSQSESGGSVYLVSNNYQASKTPWNEEELTAGNAPPINGPALSTVGNAAENTYVEFDVTSAISGNGIFSFGLKTASLDLVKYDSKEGDFWPELVVEVSSLVENQPPLAQDDTVSTQEDVPVEFDVLTNDTDSDGEIDSTTIVIVSAPEHGQLAFASGKIVYQPQADFFGTDHFTYTVKDNDGAVSNPGTVTIVVEAVNDPPVAVNDEITTRENTDISIAILENDTDPDSDIDESTVEVIQPPVNGAATVDSTSGVVVYAPNPGFSGADEFTYQVKDAEGARSNEAVVTITVTNENDPPVALDDTISTKQGMAVEVDVLYNDSDVDGFIDETTILVAEPPMNGSTSINSITGNITYTPDTEFSGIDHFKYSFKDNMGAVSNMAQVTIFVEAVNHPPVITTFQPQTLELSLPQGESIDFSVDVTDSDNDSIRYEWKMNEAVVSTSAEYVFVTNALDPNNYEVKARVSDGQAADSVMWHIEVVVTSVQLSRFDAQFNDFEGIKIRWSTSREINNRGFNLLRSQSQHVGFMRLNDRIIKSNGSSQYNFLDKDVSVGTYFYILEDINIDGRQTRHGPISVEVNAPEKFELSQNYPNPFNPETRIAYQLPKAGVVVLRIFDVLGHEVRTLVAESKNAGFHQVNWDGRDNYGRPVSSGIYYYRIEIAEFKQTKKMLFMK